MPSHSYRAEDDEKGMTVHELYEVLEMLITKGLGEVVCFNRNGDQPIRYVEADEHGAYIMEAY